jgi:UDPglucose 6-dehydrogenase
MRVSMIGVGKLGLPVAVAMAEKGHTVIGYDIRKETLESYRAGISNLYEPDIDKKLQAVLDNKSLVFTDDLETAVKQSEIIFIAVQTPHEISLDGSIRFNHVRKDFDYDYLIKACNDIAEIINKCEDYKVVSIISTVLPGTTISKIYPEMQKHCKKKIGHGWSIIYNPSFIAMSTTQHDFLNPEFTLVGEQERKSVAGDIVEKFYKTIHNSPIERMTWTEAEGVKVWYNLFIGLKIMFANTVMHLCDKLNANCDVVSDAFAKAWDRLISGKYLRGGNVDSGSCHPRDALAMSYISDELGLGYNVFDFMMTVREKHVEWFADEIKKAMESPDQQVVIMGKSYKPGTNLVNGSQGILLSNILKERNIDSIFYDPETDPVIPPEQPSIYFMSIPWPQFRTFDYSPGSIIIDPWGIFKNPPSEDVTLVSLGRRTK